MFSTAVAQVFFCRKKWGQPKGVPKEGPIVLCQVKNILNYETCDYVGTQSFSIPLDNFLAAVSGVARGFQATKGV